MHPDSTIPFTARVAPIRAVLALTRRMASPSGKPAATVPLPGFPNPSKALPSGPGREKMVGPLTSGCSIWMMGTGQRSRKPLKVSKVGTVHRPSLRPRTRGKLAAPHQHKADPLVTLVFQDWSGTGARSPVTISHFPVWVLAFAPGPKRSIRARASAWSTAWTSPAIPLRTAPPSSWAYRATSVASEGLRIQNYTC